MLKYNNNILSCQKKQQHSIYNKIKIWQIAMNYDTNYLSDHVPTIWGGILKQ
jgi:hypothetical protein